MTDAKISIIIPSYNQGEYIESTLDSIYFQDYENIEIIIVDDCSSDNSRYVIQNWLHNMEHQTVSFASYYDEENDTVERIEHRRYQRPGRTIIFLQNDKNMGSTANCNRGIRYATGEYCTFVPSDDICHPQMFSTLVRTLEQNQADFVYADMFIITDDGRIMREFQLPDYNFKRCFCDWYLCGEATLYRRELHDRFGYYDETAQADDHECYLRFAEGGARFLHVPKVLYSKRSHDHRSVGLHSRDRFRALINHSKQLTIKARKSIKNPRPKVP